MKIIAECKGEKIVLKKYSSYLDLDKDLSQFHSIDELKAHLNLEDEDKILVLYNDKPIPLNFDMMRKTISYFENKKGDDFVDWILDSVDNKDDRGMLSAFFDDRLLGFTKNQTNFGVENIDNPEGRRLYKVLGTIRSSLQLYDNDKYFLTHLLEFSEDEIKAKIKENLKGAISEYLKKDGEYNYGYMRKFIVALANNYKYTINEPTVEPIEITAVEQDKVVNEFETVIHNHNYPKKQVTFDDLMDSEGFKKNLHL